MKKPVLVSLHTSAGTGNAMGNIITAYLNRTPLILLAGQQTREMLIGEPMLTNRDEMILPQPWVKWSYQPVRAQDVPAAIMRAFAAALQPPAGPVYLSVPLDDWDQPALGEAAVRSISTRVMPDPERVKMIAEKINKSRKPVLIYGQELEQSGGWEVGVKLAEKLGVPVMTAPLAEKMSFPGTHPLYRGMLPIARGPLAEALEGYDLALVLGAPVFRYYPYVAGPTIPSGMELLQITADPYDSAVAAVGDSILGDVTLAAEMLLKIVGPKNGSEKMKRSLHQPQHKNLFQVVARGLLPKSSPCYPDAAPTTLSWYQKPHRTLKT